MFPISVLLLAFVVGFCRAGDPKLMEECAREVNIDLKPYMEYWMKNGQLPDESVKNAKCWFLCIGKKENAVDDAGNPDVNKMVEMMAPKYASKMKPNDVATLFQKCSTRSESDPCDRIYMFHKCHMQAYIAARWGCPRS